MKREDIDTAVKEFISKSGATHRYTSWDYCYNYFLKTTDLKKDLEKSSLTLGFYLASWGMFRGSSFLLQKSAKHFEPTIDFIQRQDRSVWEIDVDDYSEKNIKTIIDIYKGIRDSLQVDRRAHLTLITKILLGVFGFVPAFDNYFTETFRVITDTPCGFRSVNPKSLAVIQRFYEVNQKTIDRLSNLTFTTDFNTGRKTKIKYTKAKIIDMYGFIVGPERN